MSARPKTNKTGAKKITLTKEEWDFSTCPEDQLRWCDVYEHLREDMAFINEVTSMRKNGVWSMKAKLRFQDSRYEALATELFSLFPEFPSAPFLIIDAKKRAERCQRLNEERTKHLIQIQVSNHYYS